jgi:acyl-CoA dehydrogenase
MKVASSLSIDRYAELRARAAGVCEHFPASYWDMVRREGGYPTAFLRSLTQFGLMALTVADSGGRAGLGIAAAGAIVEELHRHGCNASKIHLQYALCFALLPSSSSAESVSWMSEVASGRSSLQMCNFLGVESSLVARQMRGGGYELTGAAEWPEPTEHCDLALLVADDVASGELSAFVVNVRAAPGMSLQPIWSAGRGSRVQLVARDAVVQESQCFASARQIVNRASSAKTLLQCAARAGDGDAKLRQLRPEREREIAESNGIAALGKVLDAARAALGRAAQMLDDGQECKREISIAMDRAFELKAQMDRLNESGPAVRDESAPKRCARH